ncbi:MAG TPA: glycosyltransferase, partial [Anaerolineae bacterium]|nr:glycosyltransferase [Anaerolineae bacterium]
LGDEAGGSLVFRDLEGIARDGDVGETHRQGRRGGRGYAACQAATDGPLAKGCVGAGTGASVGKMRYYKGIAYLIDAMRDVDAQLVLVGGGPMEAEWRARAAACAWSSRIDFVGVVPDAELPGYYHAAHVFVLPSTHRSETWGAVQVEAMACGVPCVATELGTGTSYVNLHGQTGLIVPPKDASALAAAINQLLGNEALRRQLGENARRRAQEELSVEAMLRQTLALYQELL